MMKKVLAVVLSVVLLCSVLPLQVFAREIKYFDFLPKRTKYLEHTGGHYNEDNPDEYIYDIRFAPGDIVRITAFDNNETDYTCVRNGETGELEFRAETGDVITLDELHITTSQEYGDRWFYMDGEDNHHEFTVELEGEEATASLEIVKNTVTNITFMQGEQRRYRFETDGEWKTDGQGQPYFHYALQYVSAGDMLIVGKEGVDYYYEAVWSEQEQQFYFRDEAGTDTIDIGPGGIEFTDNQAEEPFTVGDDNAYTVHYAGYTCEVSVTVDTTNITLSYTPKEPITAYLNTNGFWDTDGEGNPYFFYNGVMCISDGDILTVTDNTGESTDYISRWNAETDEREFVSAAGDVIAGSEVHCTDEQEEHHFQLGSENYFYIEYNGMRAAVPVTVKQNPVSAITFTPAHPAEICENTGGAWKTDTDGTRWYDYTIPAFQEGDVLSVTFTESGETVDYTYGSDAQTYEDHFYDAAGNILENEDELYHTRSGRWSLGDENYYKVVYFERESASIPVSIVQSNIKSLEYIPNQKQVMYFELDGEWDTDAFGNPFFRYNLPGVGEWDALIITYLDGTKKTYYAYWDYQPDLGYYEYEFNCHDDGSSFLASELEFGSNQYAEHFGIGEENAYYVTYLGQTAAVPLTIIAAPQIKAVELICAQQQQYIENTNGYWTTDEGGNDYYYYETPSIDYDYSIKITNEDDTVTLYTYDINDDGFTVFMDEQGNELDSKMLSVERDSSIRWTVGGSNEYWISYFGVNSNKLSVEIVKNPVQEIFYTPVVTPVYLEHSNGYWTSVWETDEPYYRYFLPRQRLGDVLTIKDDKGVLTDYTLTECEDGERYYQSAAGKRIDSYKVDFEADQAQTHWVPGNQNAYTISYGGATVTLYVTVAENNVQDISFVPAKPIVLEEGTGGRYIEYEQLYIYDMPVYTGDKLVVTYRDNEVVEYVFDQENGILKSADGRIIDDDNVNLYSTQNLDPWAPGTNSFFIEYAGIEKEVSLQITQTFTAREVAPTCTDWGYTLHTSPDGSISYRSDYVSARGHDFSLMVMNEQTKRTDEGSEEGLTYYYTCSRCGESCKNEGGAYFTPGCGAILGHVDMERRVGAAKISLYRGEELVDCIEVHDSLDFRLERIDPGTYSIKITANNAPSITIEGLTVAANEALELSKSDNPALCNLYLAVGDVNDDERVDIADVSKLLSNGIYGLNDDSMDFESRWDLKPDDVINVLDIGVMLKEENYGTCAKVLQY
ncbi:MAG: hypothetical protein IJJ41_02850 [Clostridia bacterium]|nr:hypothetical protein [Clostridia bacterium]